MLLNYTTTVDPEQTIAEIQKLLSGYGVTAMMTEYDGPQIFLPYTIMAQVTLRLVSFLTGGFSPAATCGTLQSLTRSVPVRKCTLTPGFNTRLNVRSRERGITIISDGTITTFIGHTKSVGDSFGHRLRTLVPECINVL